MPETFVSNPSDDRQEGGAIYQTKIGTMTFNAVANFSSNHAFEVRMHPQCFLDYVVESQELAEHISDDGS